MSGPFATATELCEYIGLPLPSDLARLQSILDLSSSVIRAFCAQELSVVTNEQVVLEPIEREILVLPERPVTAISQVLVNALSVTDYWFTRAGLLHRGTVTGIVGVDWFQGATVTYTHGYTETDPEFISVKSICMESAKRAFTADEQGIATGHGAVPMETIGFPAMQVFLSADEMSRLADFGKVLVG